jgi:hypothetical protein
MSTTSDDIQIDLDEKALDAAAKGAPQPEIEIKLDETPPKKADSTAKTPEKPILKPEDGLAKLQKQLDDEKAARIEAERRAQEASEAEVRAKTEVQGSQLDLIKNAITQITQSADILEQRYADLLGAQDFAGAAKVQREMATNAAKLVQLEAAKTNMEKAPKPAATVAQDRVEQLAQQLTPRSAAWVRAHPEFARDDKKYQKMIAAHNIAIADGLSADTDEYFNSIEETLRIKPAVEVAKTDESLSDAAKPKSERSAPPASAPVTRSGNGAGARPNVVTLSADEREMARLMFPESKNPDLDYAQNKLALTKEGKLN